MGHVFLCQIYCFAFLNGGGAADLNNPVGGGAADLNSPVGGGAADLNNPAGGAADLKVLLLI